MSNYVLLDGKQTAANIRNQLKHQVAELINTGKRPPHLVAVLVGNDGASETYIASKISACEQIGFKSTLVRLPADVNETDLLAEVKRINDTNDIDGVIVQLPLPKHIDEKKVTELINPHKDVDGFHPVNMGKLALGEDGFIAATPLGIILLLQTYAIETSGKHCVIIGRSNIVGTPMSLLMMRNDYPGNCTVTVCHSRTQNLKEHTLKADILIAAIGKSEFVTADMVKDGAVVIDVGITRIQDSDAPKGYRIAGDVKFDDVAPKCSFITPVPGGVGAMTIAGLLSNTLKAYKMNMGVE
jgi:methylenetetrahydrofolate dehydrogenase (NADP+)/methenyltetrahydrofolate cyclohydrolase